MGSLGTDQAAKKKAMWLYPKVPGFNPSERWGHSACYSHGVVYVFGGCCGGLDFSDVLLLNLDTMVWNLLATTGQGPGPRDSHSAVLVGCQMFVFGGTNGSKKVNDLHVLDLRTNAWTSPECKGIPPSPRESHTATLAADDKIIIFGGSGEGDANYLNDLHVLDLKTMTWSSSEVKGDIPVPRDSHCAVAIGNSFFVYGGDRGDRYHGDVDALDLDTLTWTKLVVQGHAPGVRAGHAAVTIGTKVYIIGGVGDKHYYNDVWVLDVVNCSWTQLDICGHQPQGRFSHTAVVTESDIAIYGGCGEDERPLNDLLVLHLGEDQLNGRYNISMCKIFGSHWNQEKRRLLRGTDSNSRDNEKARKAPCDSEEVKLPFRFRSDTPHPKRKRIINLKESDAESEQEEHSLTLSQHSSPSQSDQEHTPARNSVDCLAACQGFNLFKPLNQIQRNFHPNDALSVLKEPRNIVNSTPNDLQILRDHCKPEQFSHDVHTTRKGMPFPASEQKPLEAMSIHNLIGAEVHGKVDGAFDSGFLMTANVNGKMFRGVLFAPAPSIMSRGAIAPQNPPSAATQVPKSNHMEWQKVGEHHPMAFQQSQMSRYAETPSLSREAKVRSDLQGVVLTLGGPVTHHEGQI